MTELRTQRTMLKIFGLGIFLTLILLSCKTKMALYENQKVIISSCELTNRINDTIIISGTYYQCMEYTGFQTLKKDSCIDKFDMDLNFEQIEFPKDLLKKFYEIQGCTGTIKITLKGILKNDSKIGYGHLGTNNAELIILKVYDFGNVKYIKP